MISTVSGGRVMSVEHDLLSDFTSSEGYLKF